MNGGARFARSYAAIDVLVLLLVIVLDPFRESSASTMTSRSTSTRDRTANLTTQGRKVRCNDFLRRC